MTRPLVISVLGVTQILAWGSSYYLPAVLAAPIARDTGWPLSWVVGGLSLGLLVAALVSPRVGAAIELQGGRSMLALSATALGLGQIVLAIAPNLVVYFGAWIVIGVGMGAGLYDAAFATLGRLYGHDARAAITTLTLFGGFASTACWPLSAFMVSEVGWRGACLVYAAIQLGAALPLYLFAIPRAAPSLALHLKRQPPAPAQRLKPTPPLLLTLATTLTLAAALSALMSVHLLTILQANGVSLSAAVGLGALVGPAQVAARTVEMMIAHHHHPIWTKVASVTFVATGLSGLLAGLPMIPLALAFYGGGIGLESIARGTLPLTLFGPVGYAALMGRLAMPSLIAQAASPWAVAMLLERAGPHSVLIVVSTVAILNVAFTVALVLKVKGGAHATLTSL